MSSYEEVRRGDEKRNLLPRKQFKGRRLEKKWLGSESSTDEDRLRVIGFSLSLWSPKEIGSGEAKTRRRERLKVETATGQGREKSVQQRRRTKKRSLFQGRKKRKHTAPTDD